MLIKILIISFGMAITIGAYTLGKFVYIKWRNPFLIPIVVATILIVGFLLVFSIDYNTYMQGGKWLHELLHASVVALAYPLYEYRSVIKRKLKTIVLSTIVGSLTGIVSGIGLSRLVNIEEVIIYSIAPKSVTTPVAMEISESIGGINSLTAVFVVIAGMVGAVFSHSIFKITKLKTPIARGISIGSASHAIGTAKAFEYDRETGTFSTIAMILSALFVSIFTPIIIYFIM